MVHNVPGGAAANYSLAGFIRPASIYRSNCIQTGICVAEQLRSDVGGVCGAAANGGFGGVNPEWRTTIELPRRKGANVWTVNVTSNVTHTVPKASCSVAVEGQVVTLNVNGKSETEFRLDFGEHILDFSCSGEPLYRLHGTRRWG